MKIVYSPKHKQHSPPFEIYDDVKEEYAEKPEGIETIYNFLRQKGVGSVISPGSFSMDNIRKLHHPAYIDFLKKRSGQLRKGEILYPSYFITDTYIAVTSGTYNAAIESVNIVLTGATGILDGEKLAYSLCRPPGHHAEERSMGGYCFFNNAAIAANVLSKTEKVAILDIDFHHGNGTQNAFYERSDVLYVSLHADPRFKYPYKTGFAEEKGKGKGLGFNINYPLKLKTGNKEYLETLKKALRDIAEFNPKYLVVSLGFDTYEHDPICDFKLTIPFYEEIGAEIKTLNKPTLLVHEGGYAVDALGEIAYNFLKGLSS